MSNARPNVVVIFCDDLGYGDLACYGHPDIETPNLDQVAAEGVRFTNFYVGAAVCTPSRASLLTGRYPIRSIPHNISPHSKDGMPLDEVTIADVLKGSGYRTKAIGKWHLGHATDDYLPTSRGFDEFTGLLYSNDMMLPWCPWLSEDDHIDLVRGTERVRVIDHDQDDLTRLYTEEAVEFIERADDEPFFLYLAHSMPHLPIGASGQFRGRSRAGLYGDVIEEIDWSVGEVLRALEERGVADDTMIVFTSDNGPWLNMPARMLSGGVEPWHAGSAGALRGTKGTSWEGGFRVPAILRWPGGGVTPSVERQVASTMDLFPTIVAAAGAAPSPDRVLDGVDLAPALRGSVELGERRFFYYFQSRLECVRDGRFKLRLAQDGEPTLFDLELDPNERWNRAESEPEVVARLHALMVAFAAENGGAVRALNAE